VSFLLKRLVVLFLGFTATRAWALTIDKIVPFTTESSVRVDLALSSDQDESAIDVQATIISLQTRETIWSGALGKIDVLKGKPTNLSHKIDALTVRHWSPASPSLYVLSVRALRDGNTIATKSCRIGFRSFVARDGQFLLNGKPIFLRGLAINPPGRSIAPEVCDTRAFAQSYVKYLRGQNINIIRLEHDSQAWFDVCDEQGMMIYQGAYGSPPHSGGKSQPPSDIAASIASYRDLFETYAAHPSIVAYVLSNELPYTGTRGQAWHDFLTEVHKQLSQWDSTRPYIGNAGYGQGREGDINDVHRYWGWYYNSFLTYYNLRDPHLFGDYEKNQPLTFSECVGSFTGPLGQFNLIKRKQLAAQLEWTGHSPEQREDALDYQAFLAGQAIESFRRLRSINPRLAGLMPFTIPFFNYKGVSSFEQMRPKPVLEQMRISYQPVLLSWECGASQVYAGSSLHVISHVVNDSETAGEVKGAVLDYSLVDTKNDSILNKRVNLPTVQYYAAAQIPIDLALPDSLKTGRYKLVGTIRIGPRQVSQNQIELFVAGKAWQRDVPKVPGEVAVFDPGGATLAAIRKLGVSCRALASAEELKQSVHNGQHVLCFDPQTAGLDELEMLDGTANDPTYPVKARPTRDGMYINIEWPWHPVFAGLKRRDFRLWSDDSSWDQTKSGFPHVYPVTHGFKLKHAEDLAKTAILADYDRGLQGIALCEIFDGKGSVIVSAFDFAGKLGLDPVADRFMANLLAYAASSSGHELHPLIDKPIIWGDYATERGVLTGPMNGLIYNCRWIATETNSTDPPLADNTRSWNGSPGDQFIAKGIRPLGPFTYSAATSPRDLNPGSDTGSGFFYADVPSDRNVVVTKVENPGKQPGTLSVTINGNPMRQSSIAPGQTTTIRNSLVGDHSAVEVKYTGSKTLVILETSFERE